MQAFARFGAHAVQGAARQRCCVVWRVRPQLVASPRSQPTVQLALPTHLGKALLRPAGRCLGAICIGPSIVRAAIIHDIPSLLRFSPAALPWLSELAFCHTSPAHRPISIVLRGEARPNPWVWRVRDLQQFLAAYVRPGQEPPSAGASPAAPAGAGQPGAPAREVFRFSPGPPVDGAAAQQHLAVPAAVEAGDEVVVSPEPAVAGSAQPGSMPVRTSLLPEVAAAEGAAGAAGVAADDSDDSAALDLAALEAYIATQQASNTAAGGGTAAQPGSAAGPAGQAPLPPDAEQLQGVEQQAAAEVLLASAMQQGNTQVLPPGSTPVQPAPAQAVAQLPWPGAVPVQPAAQALPPEAMRVQGAMGATGPAVAAPAAQPAAQLPAVTPGIAPHQPAQQAAQQAAPQPELVDLTADSPPSASSGRLRAAQQPLGRGGGFGGSGGAPAGPALAVSLAAAGGVEYVDLASPTKRRHGAAEQARAPVALRAGSGCDGV